MQINKNTAVADRHEREEACCWRCCYLIAKHIKNIHCGIDCEQTEPNCVCGKFATNIDDAETI